MDRFSAGRSRVRAAIRDLLDSGEIAYVYEHGCSFIEPSFNRPVRVSRHVVVRPREMDFQPESGDIVVSINSGASFGNGRHPTTRLAIRGIETAMLPRHGSPGRKEPAARVLDIGSGSGILMLVALLMGAGQGLGLDTDPCARAETRGNIAINHLSHRGKVSHRKIESLQDPFTLVVANLRYPTLIRLKDEIRRLTAPDGMIVVSGIKADEGCDFQAAFESGDCRRVWKAAEKGWAGMVFRKIGCNPEE